MRNPAWCGIDSGCSHMIQHGWLTDCFTFRLQDFDGVEEVLYRNASMWTKLTHSTVQRRRHFRESFAQVRLQCCYLISD